MYATNQGGFVIEFRVPSDYTGPYYVWKLGFEADTIKIWKSDGSMQYVKRGIAINYSGGTKLRTGTMTAGEYTFTMTGSGIIVVCNTYALTLGTTTTTNNYHLNVYVNNKLVGDSQSYTPYERGGSVYAIVAANDIVKLALINHNIESCDLYFYPFS